MGLSRTVSEINGDFSRKSQMFPIPRVFCATAEGIPLGIGYRRIESKTRMTGLPGRESILDDIFSRLDTIDERDRRTDRQRQTAKTVLTSVER